MAAESSANEAGAEAAAPLCWICKVNKADSGEHKTKRSDLLAVLGKPSQQQPLFYHDLHRRNQPVGSLDAKILKNTIRICAHCNNTRTQPHDLAWEAMSDRLRARRLKVGQWVRCERILPYSTKRRMIDVQLFFLKLTGCMIAEAVANGHDVPIPLDPFSDAIMSGRPHREVHLQFGRHDGGIGRSDLHVWKTDPGSSILGAWLYQLDTIAVSVIYAQWGRFEHRRDVEVAFAGEREHALAAALPYLSQSRQRSERRLRTEFFRKFAKGRPLRIFGRRKFAFGNRPRAVVLITPEWAAGMDEQDLQVSSGPPVREDAGTDICSLA